VGWRDEAQRNPGIARPTKSCAPEGRCECVERPQSFRAVAAATKRVGAYEPRLSVSLFPASLPPLVPKMEQYAELGNVKLIGNA
jgi:hypothetical protein